MITNEDILPLGATKLLNIPPPSGDLYVCANVRGDFDGLKGAMKSSGFHAGSGDNLICVGDLFGEKGQNEKIIALSNNDWFHYSLGIEECWIIAMLDAHKTNDTEMIEAYIKRHGDWLSTTTLSAEALRTFGKKITGAPVAAESTIKGRKYGFIYGGVSLSDWNSFLMLSSAKLVNDSLFN